MSRSVVASDGPTCPLCQATDTRLVETVDGTVLNDLWREQMGIEDALEEAELHFHRCTACGLGAFHPPAAGKPGLYAALQKFDWYYMEDKAEYAIALQYLQEAESVLEVGAARGAFSRRLGTRSYKGLETNLSAVAEARAHNIELEPTLLEDVAARGDRFDAVVAFQVLEHVPDPLGFLAAALDVLRPGGRLVVSVPSEDAFPGSATNDLLNMPPHHVTRWSDRTFTVAASLLGATLTAVVHEPIASYHFVWARWVHVQARLRWLLGLDRRLLDQRLRARLAGKLAWWVAKSGRPSLEDAPGHTVVAVFTKPGRG